jgi:hypothetical protein
MRIISALLLLLSFQSLQSQTPPPQGQKPDMPAPSPPSAPTPKFLRRAHFSGGLTGGSINFHQNGAVGLTFRYDYNLFQGRRSSLSLGLSATIGSEDENGLFFPVEAGAVILLGLSGYQGNVDLSFSHQVVAFSDFPLMLHYNFGTGSSTKCNNHVGFYLGGGFTQTLTGYTSPATKLSVQANFWAWVVDGGIRIYTGSSTALDIGIGVERPLQAPIGPILQPVMYKLNVIVMRL